MIDSLCMPPIWEVLKALDAPLLVVVMGYILNWAFKRIEEKDRIIVDIATRSTKAVQAALERNG